MNAQEWIGQFAAAAGAEAPNDTEVEEILELAAIAAHSSERLAAPIACWIAAARGLSPQQAIALAEEIGDGGA